MTAHADAAIELYFSGKMTRPEQRDALFGHLDRCEPCRRRFDQLAEAHRLLGGRELGGALPATELALIAPTVIEGAAAENKGKRFIPWIAGVLAPAAALGIAIAVITSDPGPGRDPAAGFEPKGGGGGPMPIKVEVLCFDDKAEVVAHLTKSGSCPSPGFIKLVYASPVRVAHASVAAIDAAGEVRLFSQLRSPDPRSVIQDYARLVPSETLRIYVATGEQPIDLGAVRTSSPALSVTAVAAGAPR